MLEDVNNMLNSGEIPNLFEADDKINIMENLRNHAKADGRTKLNTNGTREQFYEYFLEKTRQNLHIVLAMSPSGGGL